MKIFSWGSNSHGQLGQGKQFEQTVHPQPLPINANVKSIVGGGKHTLLVTDNGKLYSCGDNDKGQLSKDTTVKRLLAFVEINLGVEIAKVSCGWDFNLVVTSEGDVFGWGGNSFGQLGIPRHLAKSVHRPVKVFNGKAVDVGCGLRHSVIVGKEGSVFSAGFGRKGQLGVPFDRVKSSTTFTQVPSIQKASKVSCGEHHCILCTSEDRIFAWGDNKFGQLGYDPKIHPQCGVPLSVQFQIKKIRAVASGWSHNAVLTDDGEVFTWGRNDYGQLGVIRKENWKPKSVEALKGTKQVVLGSNHGVALKNDGRILSWGWNEHGNCGNGSCDNVYDPVVLSVNCLEPVLIGSGLNMDETGYLELDDDVRYEEVKGHKNEVPKLRASDITYSEFFCGFLLTNQPVILTGVTDDWKCAKSWVKNGSLNVEHFREKYRDAEVPISNCGKRWFNIQEKCSMSMEDYLSYWESYPRQAGGGDCLYLKDWHFTKEFPNEDAYRVPGYFASDWLNEYYENNPSLNDDFRFVYIGPEGSWTPFHSDVLTSYSWSANICGRKKWILIPPGGEDKFKDEFGQFKYDIDDGGCDADACEVVQEKGEVIFVPSGWYHQVRNVEDAVSINHNWINACNILNVWESLKGSLTDVKKEISDCEGGEDWDEDCQRLLRASFGFDYHRFYQFLRQIAEARMRKLRERQTLVVYGDWSIGRNHMMFDLKRILSLLNILVDDDDFRKLRVTDGEDDLLSFSQVLNDFLNFEM